MPRSTEILELHENYMQGGIWGIGVSIAKESPHTILHIEDLRDPDGQNCNHLAQVGDLITHVDDAPVHAANISSLETIIFGPLDSVIKLSLASDGQKYDLHVQRHVPINVWDRTLRWYELKPEFCDKDFMAENKIVKVCGLVLVCSVRTAEGKGPAGVACCDSS